MKKSYKTIGLSVAILVTIVCATGWVKNLIKLSNCDFESPYKAEVVHTVGLIPIVGAVVGYMDFGE